MFGTSIVGSKIISPIKVDDGIALQNLINLTKLNVLDINLCTSQRVRYVSCDSLARGHTCKVISPVMPIHQSKIMSTPDLHFLLPHMLKPHH